MIFIYFTVIISSFFFIVLYTNAHAQRRRFPFKPRSSVPSPISSSTISTTPEAILKLVKMSLDGY